MEFNPYPLYKGLTRAATIPKIGVPVVPFMIIAMTIAFVAMWVSLWVWALLPFFVFIMAQITKYDDKAFRIWGLFIDTKLRNRKFKLFWGASTYSHWSGHNLHEQA